MSKPISESKSHIYSTVHRSYIIGITNVLFIESAGDKTPKTNQQMSADFFCSLHKSKREETFKTYSDWSQYS